MSFGSPLFRSPLSRSDSPRSASSPFARTALALLAIFLVVGGCGSGGSSGGGQNQFFLQAIGPAGGSAQAGPVNLVIPPGALTQTISVAILPELNPIPILPPPFDPCTYAYLGPIHCCGPLGQELLVPGVLRVGYDPALIPLGYTENDLVLLISNNQQNNLEMLPKTGPSVTQNQLLNFFEDTAYSPLGHVAIGIRTCPQGRILVQNNPGAGNPKPGVAEGIRPNATQLFIVDPTEVLLPALVDTSGLPFTSFLASPSRDQVLLRASNPLLQTQALYTLPLPLGGVPVEVFSDDPSSSTFMQSFDPFFGWLLGSESDEVFAVFFHPTLQSMGSLTGPPPPLDTYELRRRDALAALPEVEMHERDANFFSPDDLRQSHDGSGAMFRWSSVSFSLAAPTAAFLGGAVDVIDSPAGTPVSLGVIPPNSFGSSPRFMTQSTDLYVISNGSSVERWGRDGSFVGTLFDPGFESGETLIDFALAPDDESFAMVVNTAPFFSDFQQEFSGEQTELWMGTLTDGVLTSLSFFSLQSVNELVWHPQQTGVFLSLSGFDVGFYEVRNDKGTFINETLLPVPSMALVDVNRVDGRILILPVSQPALTAGAILQQGLYVSPADASDFQPVDMPGLNSPVQARWIESWRSQPGMDSSRVR